MATYKIVNADQLDTDLKTVADAIRAKGETTDSLSFPSGFANAINTISTGVTVQRASGSFVIPNGSFSNFYECGFKPDLVYLHLEALDTYNVYDAALAFAEKSSDDVSALVALNSVMTATIHGARRTSGFSIEAINNSNRNPTVFYTAVKYS